MPASQFELATLRGIIVERFPALAGSSFSMLSAGWDSVAVDVDDRTIFKFPRHAHGEAALIREVAILNIVRAAVSMRVPSLELFREPQVFSRHDKIPGEHLLTADYALLDEAARRQLGAALGHFYAELHAVEPADARAAGALPVESWLPAEDILRLIRPVLPDALWPFVHSTMAAWDDLAPDPHGSVYGFFDGHGWNMAFDHQAGRLNGVYDFADSGIGPLHQDFIYSNLVSPDLTERIISEYEGKTARHIDRARVDLLTGSHRLWELAMEAHLPAHVDDLVGGIAAWAKR